MRAKIARVSGKSANAFTCHVLYAVSSYVLQEGTAFTGQLEVTVHICEQDELGLPRTLADHEVRPVFATAVDTTSLRISLSRQGAARVMGMLAEAPI